MNNSAISSNNPGPTSGSGGGSTSQPGGSSGGGSGSSGSAATTAHFAYVYNVSGPTIDGFNVNQSTGALTPMSGSPFAAPNGDGLAATGGFLYAAGTEPSPKIVSYSIASDGHLVPAQTLSIPDVIRYGLFAHSSGRYLYAATVNGDIVGYQITAPGQVIPIAGVPKSIGPNASMTLSPDGKWAFVNYQQTSGGGEHVNTYAISSNTGSWSGPVVYNGSPVGVGGVPPQVGNQPKIVHLAVDPSSQYLFAANPYQNLVFAFRIGSDGSLTPVGLANGTSSPGAAPFSVAANSSFAYFGDFSQAKLSGYGFTSGTPAPTPGSPYANVGAPAYTITSDPGGHLLYVATDSPAGISVWNVASDGSLSQISGSPFSTPEMVGNNPAYVVLQ